MGFVAEHGLIYATKSDLKEIIPQNLFGSLCAFDARLRKWQEKQVN